MEVMVVVMVVAAVIVAAAVEVAAATCPLRSVALGRRVEAHPSLLR